MFPQQMRAIILQRREDKGESLLLDCLTEENQLLRVRIPGILKSKKRSAYFYFPGSLWDFTLTSVKDNFAIPKESNLISEPVGMNPDYESQVNLAKLLEPVRIVHFWQSSEGFFDLLQKTLANWSGLSKNEQRKFIFAVTLQSALAEGVLSLETECSRCGRESELGIYRPEEGNVCECCASQNETEQNAAYSDVAKLLNAFDDEPDLVLPSEEYRQKLLNILRHEQNFGSARKF